MSEGQLGRPDDPRRRRALVVTVVHHPEDARIRHREIEALTAAGWSVTYAAPFASVGLEPTSGDPLLEAVDLPRSLGRRRVTALRAARSLLRRRGQQHDVVLLHDPELLVAAAGLSLPPVVWDVHEDTAAAVTLKPWLPRPVRPVVAGAVRRAERLAERRVHLLLAEEAYRERFAGEHLVVPNTVYVPDSVPEPGTGAAVYVGHLSLARGAAELVEVGRRLAEHTGGAARLRVIGHADAAAAALLTAAGERGHVEWLGFLPSDAAMRVVDGAIAGLSLLHDEPNYRGSMPTKVLEYMAHGVPVVTTPLPLARDLVARSGGGVVVPFADAGAAADAVVALHDDAGRRRRLAAAGRRAARRHDWRAQSPAFVAELERIASGGGSRVPAAAVRPHPRPDSPGVDLRRGRDASHGACDGSREDLT